MVGGEEWKTAFLMADGLLPRAGSQRGSGRATGGHREAGDSAVGIPFVPDGPSGTVDHHSLSRRRVELRLASLHHKLLTRSTSLFPVFFHTGGSR